MPDDPVLCPNCREPSPVADAACNSCGAETHIADACRLVRLIARGAQGVTFEGRDPAGRRIAIKEMSIGAADDTMRRLVDREVSVLQQLDHPAIPRYLGHAVEGVGRGRVLYLLQAFVEGTTLGERLEAHRYAETEVLEILDALLEVLVYLHGLSPPVIHRDLKPSNVIRRPDGRLALVDFGSVRDTLEDPALGGSTLAGTYGYMAPEQYRGQASAATDIYGLGAMAVALLSRRTPAELMDVRDELAWEDAVSVSPGLRAMLRRMLRRDPAARRGDAQVLRSEVRALMAPPVPSVEAPAPPAAPRASSGSATPRQVAVHADLLLTGDEDVPPATDDTSSSSAGGDTVSSATPAHTQSASPGESDDLLPAALWRIPLVAMGVHLTWLIVAGGREPASALLGLPSVGGLWDLLLIPLVVVLLLGVVVLSAACGDDDAFDLFSTFVTALLTAVIAFSPGDASFPASFLLVLGPVGGLALGAFVRWNGPDNARTPWGSVLLGLMVGCGGGVALLLVWTWHFGLVAGLCGVAFTLAIGAVSVPAGCLVLPRILRPIWLPIRAVGRWILGL